MLQKHKQKAISKRKSVARPQYKPVPQRVLSSLGLGFPRYLDMTMAYGDQFTLTSTTGVMANYRFRVNGLFDPNFTAVGHQPAYYDVLTGIYDQWVVTKSVLHLTYFPSAANTAPFAVGIAINDDTVTTPTNYTWYNESDSCVVEYAAFSNTDPRSIVMDWDVRKSFPGSPYSNTSLIGNVGGDPTEQQIYNVFLQAVDQSTTVAILAVARLEYTVRFFELKDLVLS